LFSWYQHYEEKKNFALVRLFFSSRIWRISFGEEKKGTDTRGENCKNILS
jgi:hypothetical protein